MKHVGENIRRIRMYKGIKQEAIAFDLGITQQAVSRIEKGSVTLKNLFQIAKILEVRVEDLLYPFSVPSVKKRSSKSRKGKE